MSKKSNINEQIRSKEVRLIDQDGNQVGITKMEVALKAALEAGLDLVEISPDAKPPVCKIMDFGKYRFETEKREKEMRKKRQIVELKEIQLKCRIDTHDFNTKVNHAIRFLSEGDKVKVVVRFRGREMTHTEKGMELMQKFAESLEEQGIIEKQPLLEGYNMLMIIGPKKSGNISKGKKQDGED
ncbi:MAG: translation initiation factor IF-3 [Clostridiales bacterium GWF2_38_85]|nr:MAG: translation initiation factor IF-3 [Clostridiales bacterium GWF2_38_85]HBL84768.1 translation initiation factor IF-3 [Clostridiales bacterium]